MILAERTHTRSKFYYSLAHACTVGTQRRLLDTAPKVTPVGVPQHHGVVDARGAQKIRVTPAEVHHVALVPLEHADGGPRKHLHGRQTDRQTDRQAEGRTDMQTSTR